MQLLSAFRQIRGCLAFPFVRSLHLLSLCVSGGHGWFTNRLADTASWLSHHRQVSALAVVLVFAPSLLVLGGRGPAVFDFGDERFAANRQIDVLLTGEQLAPPPPLPPEVFTTREVELVRPDIGYASRDWGLLDKEFTQRLLLVFRLMKERHGYEMVLIEGYRSPERQEQLLARGRHVTQAGANMSYHQYGLAADAAFMREGRIAISERDPWVMRGYQHYGEIAAELGLTWGGGWAMQD
ncbi:MAG: M15 family metallopeptidase, partial [Dechloromonas sp.]